jgi:hypothetical protein
MLMFAPASAVTDDALGVEQLQTKALTAATADSDAVT